MENPKSVQHLMHVPSRNASTHETTKFTTLFNCKLDLKCLDFTFTMPSQGTI